MSEDDARTPLNESGYREDAVHAFLLLLAVSLRQAETPSATAPAATVRDDLAFRLRESPVLGRLTELERQDLDDMREVLETALESETLKVADLNPDDDSVH